VVGDTGLLHRREDRVGRAVQDRPDPCDTVRGEVRGERVDDRDAAGDRGLEPERGAGPARDGLELRAVVRDDVLVGGDDRLAGAERGRDQRVGGLVAAHQLADDVDVGVGHQVGGRVGEQLGREVRGTLAVDRSNGHAGQLESGIARAQAIGSLAEGAYDLAADGTGAEHGDAEGGAPRGHARNGSRALRRARGVEGRRYTAAP
jgi:hypothetical protein